MEVAKPADTRPGLAAGWEAASGTSRCRDRAASEPLSGSCSEVEDAQCGLGFPFRAHGPKSASLHVHTGKYSGGSTDATPGPPRSWQQAAQPAALESALLALG